MGRVADAAGIQFRLLNRSKGPAVRGPRAQADRKLYRAAMQAAIRGHAEPEVIEGAVDDLMRRGRRGGRRRRRRAARRIPRRRRRPHHGHVPARPDPHGRAEDPGGSGRARRRRSACRERFWRSALRLGRLKTGTPARLDGRTIDWASLEMQAGDDRSRAVLLPDRADHHRTDRLRRHRDHDGDPRASSAPICTARRCIRARSRASGRATVRPSRTRWCALPAGRPPDLPRARGPGRRHRLSQRHLDLAAGRGAGPVPAHHSGPGEGGHPAARLCHRI